MPAFGSYSRNLERPNELWELDSSPTDIYLSYQDHDGAFKRKRFALIACIDVFTRRTKIRVAETSNSEEIALLLRDCILDWGLPGTLKMDNGKDYASKLIQRF
ncbi:integrase catalytic domain-containing protein, partial [Crocosphaera watsonii]